jgi:hypothetical protein
VQLFRNASSEESEYIIGSLGFTAASHLPRVFDFAIQSRMRPQQRLDILQSCATATPHGRRLTLQFARHSWKELAALCDGLFGVGELIMALCFDLVGREEMRDMEAS